MVTVAYNVKTVMGDRRVEIIQLTNVTDADTFNTAGIKRIEMVIPIGYNVALAEQLRFTWSGQTITCTTTSNSATDDYYVMVIGK